jgi:hypothetical protein
MKKLSIVSMILAFVLHSAILNAGNDNTKEPSIAQITISGTITDSYTGESLIGVTVSLEGTEKIVYTDFYGKFEITGLTPGNYILKTEYISYQGTTSEINVNPDKKNEVVVKLKSKEDQFQKGALLLAVHAN